MKISELYKIYKKYPFVSTDSRDVSSNSLFFALKGERFNGNKFAETSIKNGCKFAIIDEKKYCKSEKYILVKNVLSTLQGLAKYHRSKLKIPIIGITGTNGKTTTKNLIRSILSSNYNTYSTKGNLNNQIGVPLSILEIKKSHKIAIIEMGANQLGEIENLCQIAQPTEGIITNIGIAHLEGFGNMKGVTNAKTELYNFIHQNNGTLFINYQDNLLMSKSNNIKRITYGNTRNADYHAELINPFPFVSVKIGKIIIKSNLIGKFQYDNILASCVMGNYFNVPLKDIKKSIESYIPQNNRSQIIKTKHNNIILDAYNANPSSMENMIDSFYEYNERNKICILGDMKELGEYSKTEHDKIIKKINNLNIETIYIGREFNKSKPKNSFLDVSDFLKNLKNFNLENRTILIKGSRSIRLEQLIKDL